MSETKTEVATSSRTITIVSTRGDSKKKIEFSGKTWKELKPILQKEGYNIKDMKFVESEGRHTLEHDDAIIPVNNFNLFTMPYKNKSGVKELNRTELYEKIKKAIEKDSSGRTKDHFYKYTNMSTEKLRATFDSWDPAGKVTRATTKAVAKTSATNDMVENVKSSSNVKESLEALEGSTVDEKLDVVIILLAEMRKSGGQINGLASSSTGNNDSANTTSEKAIPRKPEKSKEEIEDEAENDRLAEEGEDIMKGFH